MNEHADITKRPELSDLDVVHTAAKAVLSALPGIGGPATELFVAVFKQPLESRRDQWVELIARGLSDLQKKVAGLDFDALQRNQAFITTALHASQLSIRNHQEEKLTALRNAVLNAALPGAPTDDLQAIYLSYVDYLTPWHMRLLRLFHDPTAWESPHEPSTPRGPDKKVFMLYELQSMFPELSGQGHFLVRLAKDLHERGLTQITSLMTDMTEPGAIHSWTTPWGKDFVRFISEPEPLLTGCFRDRHPISHSPSGRYPDED